VQEIGDLETKTCMTTRNQFVAFTFLCAVSIVLWWRPLGKTLSLALSNDAYTHILLIVPLSVALIYLDSKSPQIDLASNRGMGATLLVVAVVATGYARWGTSVPDTGLSVAMFALVAWWIGSIVFCFGARTIKAFLFPLCFLFLIVPIPKSVLSGIVASLQQQSAVAARLMFRLAGVPATQDGIMVSIPGLDIEVARECSSIRSSLMLIVTTMVLAHLLLRSRWRKGLLIAAAFPLSAAKNGLRIFTIAQLGTRVDQRFLDGNLHHHGGILFFGIAVVAVGILVWVLRRTETPVPSRS
jgi:exosortase